MVVYATVVLAVVYLDHFKNCFTSPVCTGELWPGGIGLSLCMCACTRLVPPPTTVGTGRHDVVRSSLRPSVVVRPMSVCQCVNIYVARLGYLCASGGIVALSVECRTCDQEVVGSSLGRARGVKTLGKFVIPMCLCSPSSISWYRPKGGDTLRLGSEGRYGSCVGGR